MSISSKYFFIDTHAHLNFAAFKDDYTQVIKRAQKAGVKKIINVGAELETSGRAIELAQKYDGLYASVGIHPIHIEGQSIDWSKLKELAGQPRVAAIGETGLDFFREYGGGNRKGWQKEAFVKFLDLANDLKKPVILHCRDAYHEMLKILVERKRIHPDLRFVIHCFSAGWPIAQEFLKLGSLISFTGIITYPNTQYLWEVVEKTPLEKIMLETDCPYLPLQSKRGQRNEPTGVIEIAKKIVEIKNFELSKVAAATTQTAEEFFGL